MDQNLTDKDFCESGANVDIPLRNTIYEGEKSNNQCDFASFQAGNLRRHLKTHSGEKLIKCNQYNYASFYTGTLRRHLKTHSGERLNKCNQRDYASSHASNLRTHLKNTCEKSQTNATNVTMSLIMQAV